MKKQKIKESYEKYRNKTLATIFVFFVFSTVTFATIFQFLINPTTSTTPWSFNSIVSFTWTIIDWKQWYYINDGENSAVIWNYFKWYYFDSLHWYFKLDWSSNKNENVRIVDSTNKCSNSYWYKLAWKAYSENAWYIDFNYNNDTYVYWCRSDKKLHWFAYNKYTWYQNFDWVSIDVITDIISDVKSKKI